MKYKSEVIHFKNNVIDIPDDNIIVKYIFDSEIKSMYETIPKSERVIVLVPIKEE